MGPADPYIAYLDEHGLAETHLEDLADRHWSGGRKDNYYDATFPTLLPDHAYVDNWIPRTGLGLIEDVPGDRPWFLQVNFTDPHGPWDVTEDMYGWYRDPDVAFPDPVDPEGVFDPETHQEIRRNYAAMIENVDRWLGRYRERLQERGEWADTVVVFASDHGEMLGDHGQWTKRSPYQPSVGVPLIVAGPGVEARGSVAEPASVLDLHSTFLDIAGLDTDQQHLDSRSLGPYLRGQTDQHRDVVYSGVGPWRVAFDGRFKLVRGYDRDRKAQDQVGDFDAWNEAATKYALRDREPILFDLESNPAETEDLAADHPAVVERLSARIDDIRTAG